MNHQDTASILVVDDTPENLQLLVELLQAQGYKIHAAPNGPRALASAQMHPPDLILLDIKMPNMDGYEVCQRLKADERTRDIPIIFLSALSETFDKVQGFQLGAVDYLNKPIAPEELLARVRTHLAVHALQAQLAAQNAQLQQEIIERQQTADELQRYREHLEAANRELQSFAYSVSHDLKAPLRGIHHIAHWLLEDCRKTIDPQGQEYLDLLIVRVKRLEAMIDGILHYSRIGRLEGQPSPIDLNGLLRDIVDSLAPPPHIRIRVAGALPVLVGNPIRIQQVFQNLLNNAIKFMDKPAGDIAITCQETGDGWQFGVSDNGPGIAPQFHDRIFEIFQTGRARDESDSTGIGLAIVKKIVEFYSGQIGVKSVEGQGSTFWFTLPKAMKSPDDGVAAG